jgi:hypothetical protein
MLHSPTYYTWQRLQPIVDYARSMGRPCYIEDGKVHIEVEQQTPNGAVYNITKQVTSLCEAKLIIQDD